MFIVKISHAMNIRQRLFRMALNLILVEAVIVPAALFSRHLLYPLLGLIVFQAVAFALLTTEEKGKFVVNLNKYVNESLLADLGNLPISKRSIEFYAVIYVVLVVITAYFAEAIPFVIRFWRSIYE